jgi:hypothetical protein
VVALAGTEAGFRRLDVHDMHRKDLDIQVVLSGRGAVYLDEDCTAISKSLTSSTPDATAIIALAP